MNWFYLLREKRIYDFEWIYLIRFSPYDQLAHLGHRFVTSYDASQHLNEIWFFALNDLSLTNVDKCIEIFLHYSVWICESTFFWSFQSSRSQLADDSEI
jgi:hypothetical protein